MRYRDNRKVYKYWVDRQTQERNAQLVENQPSKAAKARIRIKQHRVSNNKIQSKRGIK